MKNLGIIVSFFLILGIPALAQTDSKLQMKFSEELKGNSAHSLYDIIPCKEGCFYTLKYNTFNGKKAKLYHYEKDFVLTDIKSLPLKHENKKLQFESIFCVDHAPFYVCSNEDKTKKKRNFFVFSATDKQRKPFSFSVQSDKDILNQIDYRYSPDKSKLMLVVSLIDGNLNTFIFDKQLSLIRKETVRMEGYEHTYEELSLDNQGNAYFLVSKNQPAGKEYTLITSVDNTIQTIEKPECLEGKTLLNMQMTNIIATDEVVCAGYYSDPLQENKKGIYLFTIKNQEINCAESHLLDEQKIKEGFEKKIAWNNLEIGNIIPKRDGTFLLVAEEYFEEDAYVGNITGSTNMEDKFFGAGDILISSIKKTGEIQWCKRIKKGQFSLNDNANYNSYTTAIFDNKLYVFYNDQTDQEKFKVSKDSPLVYLVLDNKGNTIDKQKIFDSNDFGVLAQPQMARQNESGEIILFGQKNSKERFFKFSPQTNQ